MDKIVTNPTKPDLLKAAMGKKILTAANQLFAHFGFNGTTMKTVAQLSGCSVGHLYKHCDGKQDLLNILVEQHMDVWRDIRHNVRRDSRLSCLDCLQREGELLCLHFVDHRALIPVVAERESLMSQASNKRSEEFRREDIAFIDGARRKGEVPNMDPVLLVAVIDGASWGLFKALSGTQNRETFLTIPKILDALIFAPLRDQVTEESGKEQTNS